MTEQTKADWIAVKRYAVHNADGSIAQIVGCPEKDRDIQFIPEGGGILPVKDGVDWSTHHVHEGKVRSMGTRPSAAHRFDHESKSWKDPRTLDDLKGSKWSDIKKERDALEFGGFLWEGHLFDSTPISQQRISHAAQAAMIAQTLGSSFTRDWTLADNTQVLLNAVEMLAVAAALNAHIELAHSRSRFLREKIESAGSTRAIKGIDWVATPVN